MSGNRRARVNNAPKPESKRFNVMLRAESLQRLLLHALMLKKNPGDLLSDLIDQAPALKEFRVQRNPGNRATQSGSADPAVEVKDSVAEAA
jgi:hypothetical protein